MAWRRNWSRHRNKPLLLKTCDLRFLACRLLYLHIIRKYKRGIWAMNCIPTCTSFLFLVAVSSSLFLSRLRPRSANSSNAVLGFQQLRSVMSAMNRLQRSLLYARSLIQVTQWSIQRSHCLGPAPRLLMMIMDWAISHMRSLTVLSIRCVIKPPLSCQIPIVSAAH